MLDAAVFDTIVVGAGSAGCLLADRLSADPARRVLLLEAGGSDKKLEVRIPAAFSKLFKTERDWAFATEPEPHAEERRLYIPRGKMLGGSSSINAMIYIRGNRVDYDGWAANGCTGWSYDEVLPIFKRIEDQERGPSAHHGTGGPLKVQDLRSINELSPLFITAAAQCGLAMNEDFNGPSQGGFGFYQVTQKDGRRWSAADAFLRPAIKRPNLAVRTNAHCTRILFDGRRARGIEYRWKDRLVTSEASTEIVLSAGAIQSPQLLLLSGIGDREVIAAHGIDPVAHLPGVGQNLQDHPFTGVAYQANRAVTLDVAESIGNTLRFLFSKRGPLTSNIAEAGGFVRSSETEPAPDLQYHFAPAHYVEHGFSNPEGCGFSIGPTLIAPDSRGSVSLASNDPFAPPSIVGNNLSAPRDLARLLHGLRLARQLGEQRAFDELRGDEYLPGPELQTDAQLEQYIREQAELIYHPVGTCRMGTGDDAVVDGELKVHGIEGLRVIDASVMPTIVRGNTNAATYMIAEKGAEMILRESA